MVMLIFIQVTKQITHHLLQIDQMFQSQTSWDLLAEGRFKRNSNYKSDILTRDATQRVRLPIVCKYFPKNQMVLILYGHYLMYQNKVYYVSTTVQTIQIQAEVLLQNYL